MIRVSTSNALANHASADIQVTVAGAAPGVASEDLVREGIDRVWVSSASRSALYFSFRMTQAVTVDFFACFDFGPMPAVIAEVEEIDAWPSGVRQWMAPIIMGPRGDGSASLSAPRVVPAGHALRFRVTRSSAAILRMGLLWAGRYTELPKSYARRRDTRRFHAVVNETESMGRWTHELADYTEEMDLGFGRLTDAEALAVRDILTSARGSLRPVVLLPDASKPAEVYHGRLQEASTRDRDFPTNTGLALNFRESGRGLHV